MTLSKIHRTRIENILPVAREGIPFIIIGAAVTCASFFIGFTFVTILMGFLSLFIVYFFRDPERKSSAGDGAILTPADGKVIKVLHLENVNNPLEKPSVKISIFMSVFNVHVNRIPISGRVTEIVYSPGKFFSANLDKASEENEKNRITLETDNGQKIVFTQIAGLIARRIVCWINKGDYVKAGQRFGLIRFGSRLDIYLPSESRIITSPGQRVRAGETILGYLDEIKK